eukprot:11158527-Lingulodinium_polyedra.AAC.1
MPANWPRILGLLSTQKTEQIGMVVLRPRLAAATEALVCRPGSGLVARRGFQRISRHRNRCNPTRPPAYARINTHTPTP